MCHCQTLWKGVQNEDATVGDGMLLPSLEQEGAHVHIVH